MIILGNDMIISAYKEFCGLQRILFGSPISLFGSQINLLDDQITFYDDQISLFVSQINLLENQINLFDRQIIFPGDHRIFYKTDSKSDGDGILFFGIIKMLEITNIIHIFAALNITAQIYEFKRIINSNSFNCFYNDI